MSTYWVELHCEGHSFAKGCYSDQNDNPCILICSLSRASKELAQQATERRWQKMSFGWLCPNCFRQGWRPSDALQAYSEDGGTKEGAA